MGPASGGRIAAVAGVPGDPNTYYAGAASGGVWKSTDGGEDVRARVRCDAGRRDRRARRRAVRPEHRLGRHRRGVGDPRQRRDGRRRLQVARTPARTWTHVGLDETGRIGRIIVHPTNPDIVFVCALGPLDRAAAGARRLRTTDGGTTWERVLFADPNTGCSGLAMDATNPNVLLAGTWQVEMHTWAELSGGPGSAVYISHDGGAKWTKRRRPRPAEIAARQDRRRDRAEQSEARLRADSDRESGLALALRRRRRELADRQLGSRADRPRRLLHPRWPSSRRTRTKCSSRTAASTGRPTAARRSAAIAGCGDCHDIWMDPKNADRFVDHRRRRHEHHHASTAAASTRDVAADRPDVPRRRRQPACRTGSTATGRTTARCAGATTWWSVRRTARASPRRPGAPPALAVAAARRRRRRIRPRRPARPWEHDIGGCESGFTLPDPTDPDIVWASCYGNKVTR